MPATARPPIRVLVVVPTRELAHPGRGERPHLRQAPPDQVDHGLRRRRLRSPGGQAAPGPEIVVATPGRLLDHVSQRTIDLSQVEILVLDEADRMLDMGFIRDIRKIIALLPKQRQNLLFSATFSDEIRSPGDRPAPRSPPSSRSRPRNTTTELIEQVVIPVDRERKRELLSLPDHVRPDRAGARVHAHQARRQPPRRAARRKDGISAAAIHGNKSQGQRVRALDDFKAGAGASSSRPTSRRAGSTSSAAPRRELRAADGRRGLRPPHRPNGPRRQGRRGDLAGVRRRAAAGAGHPGPAPSPDPDRDHRGLRAQPEHPPGADPAPLHARRASRAPCRPRRPARGRRRTVVEAAAGTGQRAVVNRHGRGQPSRGGQPARGGQPGRGGQSHGRRRPTIAAAPARRGLPPGSGFGQAPASASRSRQGNQPRGGGQHRSLPGEPVSTASTSALTPPRADEAGARPHDRGWAALHRGVPAALPDAQHQPVDDDGLGAQDDLDLEWPTEATILGLGRDLDQLPIHLRR